jgi:hypothetical protein
MSATVLHGRRFGKDPALVDATEIKATIPLPSVLQVADAFL